MRILVVTHYALPHLGGIEVVVDGHTRELARQGHEVTHLASRCGAVEDREVREGVQVLRVAAWNGLERSLHVPWPLFSPALVARLWRAVGAADAVHLHGLLYLGSVLGLLVARLRRRRVIVTEHVGFVPYHSRVLRAVQRLALALASPAFTRLAHATIACNTRVHAWLRARAGDPQRVHLVPNGVDAERFHPPTADQRRAARAALQLPSEGPLVLFVGRLVEKKRLERLSGGAWPLLLCGPGEVPPSLRGPGVHHRVVPHEVMPLAYQACDLLVMPSEGEGLPVAVSEAMASGLPVVAVRDEGYAPFLGEDVLQVEPDALHDAVRRLLQDEPRRRSLADRARRRAVESLSVAASVRRHLEILVA